MPLSAETAGITATLIDFTLSRCVVDGCALFDEFEDEDLFKGTGDEQYDVYRRMRQVVESEGGGWGAGHLRTNVLVRGAGLCPCREEPRRTDSLSDLVAALPCEETAARQALEAAAIAFSRPEHRLGPLEFTLGSFATETALLTATLDRANLV